MVSNEYNDYNVYIFNGVCNSIYIKYMMCIYWYRMVNIMYILYNGIEWYIYYY